MHIAPVGGQEHIWLTGRLDTHPPTRSLLTCCRAAIVGRVRSGAPDTPAHSYTNKQTHLLLLTIGRRREGEQNKQFNLHDSGLLYISRPRR